ncbi:hypothetical protein QTP88_016691 [Uroleucon formosanum]
MLIFRFPKRGCQTTRSARVGSRFFHFTDLNQCCNSGLTLCEIVELVFMFVLELPIQMVMDRTGKSKEYVTDWFNMCREVCTAVLKTKRKMVGNAQNPIQFDEARFAGRRKCLTSRGFVHKTVNHQISYVDTNTGAHTQNIERSLLDAKVKLLKKMRGVPLNHLQSHLDHYYWRLYRQDRPDLFLAMLEDIENVNESQ